MKQFLRMLLMGMMFASSYAFAQQTTITGNVKSTDGDFLSGVSVLVKGTNQGTSTNSEGKFSINVPTNAILIFRFVGYETKEVSVGESSVVDVTLTESSSSLAEVAVTAFGIKREERSLGYTAQSVTSEDLNFNKQPNMVNALQGKVAGVQIRSTGGAPGQGAKIQIRGINSLDPTRDNSPLFVVDGVIMDNSTSTQGLSASGRGMSNRAVDINPEDIESMNILRGGAATALYGLRGSNGVVVITTKQGKSGDIRVNYQGSVGLDEVNKLPKMQDVYTQGWNNVYDPSSFWPAFGPTVEEARAIDPTHPAKLYNYLEDAFETGHQYKNVLNISGGSDKISYYSSLSQFSQKGIMPFTDFKNIQARLNTTIRTSDKFSIATNLNVTNSGGDRGNAGRFNEQLSYWVPRWDVTNYEKEDGTMYMGYSGLSVNPIYVAKTNRFFDDVLRFIGNTTLNYKPTKWLDLTYTLGVDTYRDNRQSTAPAFRGLEGEIIVEDNGDDDGQPGGGFYYVYDTKYRTFNSTFIASISHQFTDDFGASLRLGNEIFDRKIYRSATEGFDLTVWNWFSMANANQLRAGTNREDYRLMGTFADVTLNFKDYLFLNATLRNDITSSLLKPNNSFYYPSASLSYVLSDHVRLPEVMDHARLRFSYAQIGKDALAYSTSLGYQPYAALPTGYTGFTRNGLLGEPNLRPEFTNTYEAGLVLHFFKQRLRFDGNIYRSDSKDQIMSVPISTATGYSTAAVNLGDIRNTGVELTIGGTPIKNNNFTWDTEINLSANRNKVLSINEDLGGEIVVASEFGYLSSNVSMRVIPGQPYGILYGRTYQRYYTDAEKAAGLNGGLTVDENRPLLIGANGFPVLSAVADVKQLGNVFPKWIGGWHNTFRYKNVSLSMLVDGQFGQKYYNQMDNFLAAFGMAEYTLNRNDHVVFEGVLADGTPNTQQVWLGQGYDEVTDRNYGNGYYRDYYRGNSEFFVQNASWVKLRSLSFSYNFPSRWFSNKLIKNVSASITGNNLFVITDFNGYDPENSTTNSGSNVEGFAGMTYPALRSYLFTLNVGF
ncbi:SusC/RagA family TonB-linked outer membrane protein [Olivibacter sitiensis]|uniref:SusC/RagA family TonB-linked outer membrane protein n=1 Tax=Olivibacter sitiensis TaxID=376470 RepID=UPI00048238F6|nr:SusC/RagA family TonB-linked outer membrane protein [Olivibacter sitiensis]